MQETQRKAIEWLERRAAENTAHPEENAVLPYLIELVEKDAKTAQAADEVNGVQTA
ncbi:hypothetical protein LRP50_05260 [Enterovibrio sp. ZSDZ42]|uniref:Uncharacterized protein n=1 Tax=Enterovibrio gelatinilyticus TaxID=2899819 RepID=A0ABT5QY50_9GAMM|nr:hypothetical protein [Enterovibrio sp. ZSDZ42]MDD1792535.1 hypothetical protein [Enterovibrio sp. ZSDZ42]